MLVRSKSGSDVLQHLFEAVFDERGNLTFDRIGVDDQRSACHLANERRLRKESMDGVCRFAGS